MASDAYYDPEHLSRFAEIGREKPDLAQKFFAWYGATLEAGELTKREKALIGLAVAHVLQCPYCIDAFAESCLETGGNVAQMTEAIHVAAAVRGGASLIHGLQALDTVDRVSM